MHVGEISQLVLPLRHFLGFWHIPQPANRYVLVSGISPSLLQFHLIL
jgi:hypothetical protein